MLIKNIFPQINKKAAPFNKDKTAANSEPYSHQFH